MKSIMSWIAWRESSSEGPGLTRDIDADLPPVLGDEQALKSMVRNLVSNAMKFTPAGGDGPRVRWANRVNVDVSSGNRSSFGSRTMAPV